MMCERLNVKPNGHFQKCYRINLNNKCCTSSQISNIMSTMMVTEDRISRSGNKHRKRTQTRNIYDVVLFEMAILKYQFFTIFDVELWHEKRALI